MSEENSTTANDSTDTPAIDGSAYDLIRTRLETHAKTLGAQADALNGKRIEVFGGTEMGVIGNERVRTENNCIPRDIVSVGGRLLFGYNVFIGLKKETNVEDVLSLHTFTASEDGTFEFETVPTTNADNFLADPRFKKEFTELVTYYKDASLVQLRTTKSKLLAIFKVGERTSDVKAFRWAIDADGGVTYVDNRGDEDHVFPPSHDFEWVETGRDHFVLGRHPHVNILDEVFVETVGGDLTVKVEDNTEDGQGIYAEDVSDKNQSLADGQISYAKLGVLILLKILPYREEQTRYLVFNTRTKDVQRIDGIGQACVQLPEDHGIIFPGGYYLQSGESKTFDLDTDGLRFLRQLRSPNGEDVLFQFYEESAGRTVLFPYNLIRKEVATPILCHGSSIFDDGKMVVFRAEEEPTRVHHMQIWRTAFMSDEEAAKESAQSEFAGSFLVKIGNPDLVRGISDAQSIRRAIANQTPSMAVYEDLISFTTRVLDSYHWLTHADVGDLATTLHDVRKTAELVIDEFEKLLSIQASAREALVEAEREQEEVLLEIRPETWETVDQFVDAMARLRSQRGRLITLKDMRSIDLTRVEALEGEVAEKFDYLSDRATAFLTEDDALKPYRDRSDAIGERIEAMEQGRDAEPITEDIDQMATGLDLLTEVVSGLKIDDATARTRILEEISGVFALVNRARAGLAGRRKALLEREGVAEFGAQFKLLTQSVQSAIGLCDTPEKCDEQLTRLMVSLEELEGKFGEFDQFLGDLAQKRDEIYETFTGRKQQLLEERQRRAQNLANAADRILQGVARRANTFKEVSELNAYFASDAMVMKVRDIGQDLLEVGDTVRADEIQSRIKKAREDAIRQLRDKSELFDEEGGDQVVKFGQHRFTVNTQALDLTLLPRDDGLALHLTGTDFFEQLTDDKTWGPKLLALQDYWNRSLVSESADTYRGEYLAASILFAAERNEGGLTLERLHHALLGDGDINHDDNEPLLLDLVREVASERYDEAYDRGVHDHDAALILEKLLNLYSTAGLLRFSPRARGLAVLFWGHLENDEDKAAMRASWVRRARSFGRLRTSLGHTPALASFAVEVAESVSMFNGEHHLDVDAEDVVEAGTYLVEELMGDPLRFTTSAEATRLVELFYEELDALASRAEFDTDVRELAGDLKSQAGVVRAWVEAFLDRAEAGAGSEPGLVSTLRPVASEAVSHILVGTAVSREISSALSSIEITGLLGNHARIRDRTTTVRLDEFLDRLRQFATEDVARFRAFRDLRHELLEDAKERMRLEEFKPRVLSSFVRNKLINDVYLPLVGDNLAKQIGGVGAKKRTDLMGLLLLISPPGYGKTTLMEYIASRLGLVFMKVNGPSLGHDVHSLDPAEAPNATARQEVEKINLAFEMGNNVMLYLDDIQHTHPELLQKFISLCDGSRRIEGVWKGKTRTYDLRGKKFCVVMAGNPYTESGDKFQIPDMLSNRADTYNLGDILGGREDAFALSYIENALTSNPVMQPLATREQKDVYQLVRMAKGEDLPLTDLSHGYSGVEVDEILSVMRKMLTCQDVLLKVNAEYIRSASMDDRYRTEPRFQLQGSYRNMNKLAEKVVAVMNDDELERVVSDHYQQEAQTLTTGAEQNLLKLRELRGTMSEEEAERWDDVKKTFARNQMSGGDDDPITKVTTTLAGLSQHLGGIRDVVEDRAESSVSEQAQLQQALGNLSSLQDLAGLVKNVGALKSTLDDSSLAQTLSQSLTDALSPVGPGLAALEVSGERTTRAMLKAGQVVAETGAKATQAHSDQMAALLGNLPIQVDVNVPTEQFVSTLAQQQNLVEGSLLPVLQAALGAQSAANNATAATIAGAKKTAEIAKAAAEQAATSASANAAALAAAEAARAAAAATRPAAVAARGPAEVDLPASNGQARVRSAPVEMDAVPSQVAESLVLLRELFTKMENGEFSASATYKRMKPMGTRAEDD